MVPGCFATLDISPNPLELARQRRVQGPGYIDLTSSNPTHQGILFPPDVLRTAANAYWKHRRYDPDPHGMLAARQSIATYYAERLRHPSLPSTLHTSPPPSPPVEAIYLTASTSEAYSLLFALLADPGDNILAPDVTYPLFEYLAEISHVELRSYRLDETRNWQIDEQSVLEQTDDHTRAILIISPHNPTGSVVSHTLPALEQTDLPLICDEVFAAFPYRVAHVVPLGALYPSQAVFHLNGISKLFALPDLKLGWIALNGPAQTTYGERLELLNDTFLGANSLIQTMLPALFSHSTHFVATMTRRIRHAIDLVLDYARSIPALDARPPDGGYYLFPAVHGWDDEEELVLHLLEHGVLVHPGYFYGDVAGTHIMISALTYPEHLAQGMERLGKALNR